MVFLQKTLAWFSKFYLRVQNKKSGRNNFFILLFRFFSDFEQTFFRLLRQKTSRSCQKYPVRVQTNNFLLEETFKSFESFWIFCRNLWHCSQNSIYVSRVKTAEEIVFFVFRFRFFFRILSENFSDFWPKIFNKFSNLPSTCPEEQFVAWNFLLKFWILLDFLQKPLAGFSNFYLCVQSKNSGKNNFFILLFRVFFGF